MRDRKFNVWLTACVVVVVSVIVVANVYAALRAPEKAQRATSVPMVQVVDSKPAQPRCVAEVTMFEDGSWAGGKLTFDGEFVFDDWAEHMPETGWQPAWKGETCYLKLDVPAVATEVSK